MSRIRKGLGLAAAGTLLAGGLLGGAVGYAGAQDATPAAAEASPAALPAGCSVVAGGLANPRHLTIGDGGIVYVALAGAAGDTAVWATPGAGTPAAADPASMTGDSGAVAAINADGTVSTAASGFPSSSFGTEVVGPAGVAAVGTTLYVVTGGAGPMTPAVDPMNGRGAVWSVDVASGQTKVVADLEGFERANNPDPHNIDSNPYAIIAGKDGMLYVADAGGNDILKVDPTSGTVSLVAVIPGLPGQQENPERGGAKELDPVPTGLAWAPDGGLYVSTLSGGPFIPGTAALFHVALDGTVTQVAGGLTMLGDVTVGPDGSIYLVTMSDNFIDAAGPAPGSIVKLNADGTSTTVLAGLPFPGGIAFDANGDAYISAMVSLPVGTPAGGMVIKCGADAFAAAAPAATPAG